MHNNIPTTTNAQERAERHMGAITREEAQQLARIDAAKRAGMALDGRKHAIPFEPGKIALSVELGAASIRWNATPAELFASHDRAADFLASTLPKEAWRQAAREGITQTLQADAHLEIAAGTVLALLASFLMLSGEGGLRLRAAILAGRVRHAGYLVTETEPGAYNFRLVAGG